MLIFYYNNDIYIYLYSLNNIVGKFAPGAAVKGNSSSASFVMSTFVSGSQNDPLEMIEDEFADNVEFEVAGDSILDFTEKNPFGEVGNRS